MMFCGNCGQPMDATNKFCGKCGKPNSNREESTSFSESVVVQDNYINENRYDNCEVDYSYLSDYYQDEFNKITEYEEAYKGKWNWAAFLFGGLWALTKGLWLSAVVCIVLNIITSGIASFVYCVIYGFRGNYMYYNKIVKNKQIPF